MSRTYNTIDSDGHVLEAPDLWKNYIDPKFRDRAPQVVKNAEGRSRLSIDNVVMEPQGNPRGISVTGGIGYRWGAPQPNTYEEGRAGGFDPHERIADLDLDGIDAAFLYPTLGLIISGRISDPEYGAACCRAYNRWLADYCSAYPDRLFGVAMLPMQNVEVAVQEARYAGENLGFHGTFIRPNPYNDRLLSDRDYDPLWDTLKEFDLSCGIHEGVGGAEAIGVERVVGISARHMVSHTLEMMTASLNLIWGGVCERYPEIRFGFLESGGGWMAGWLDRMDRHFEDQHMRGDDGPPKYPSEYFRRQCWQSFEPVEKNLPYLVEYLGPEKILWATDYPHSDGFFPGAPKMIADMLPDPVERHGVLAGGAMKFYNLK